MIIKKRKIKLSFLIAFIIMPFCMPDYLALNSSIANMTKVWMTVSMIITPLVYFKKIKMDKRIIYVLVPIAILILSTVISGTDIVQCVKWCGSIVAFTMLIDMYSRNDEDTKCLINTLYFIFNTIIFLNFMSIILNPHGLYVTATTNRNYFLGFDNTHIQFYLPTYLITLIKYQKEKKKRYLIPIIFVVSSSMICQSATAKLGMAVITILTFVPYFKKNRRIFNFKNYNIIILTLFFMIIIFRVQNIFSFIIEDMLHKDLTFTGRIAIWDSTIQKILENPILGNGWQDYEIRKHMYNSLTAVTSHNQLLEFLYLGGASLASALIIFIKRIQKIMKNDKNNTYYYFCITYFVLNIVWVTEVYLNSIIFLVLIFLLYSDRLVRMEVNNESKS